MKAEFWSLFCKQVYKSHYSSVLIAINPGLKEPPMRALLYLQQECSFSAIGDVDKPSDPSACKNKDLILADEELFHFVWYNAGQL